MNELILCVCFVCCCGVYHGYIYPCVWTISHCSQHLHRKHLNTWAFSACMQFVREYVVPARPSLFDYTRDLRTTALPPLSNTYNGNSLNDRRLIECMCRSHNSRKTPPQLDVATQSIATRSHAPRNSKVEVHVTALEAATRRSHSYLAREVVTRSR